MKTNIKKETYFEHKRQIILSLGYDYIKFRSRTKKSLNQLKNIIKNNACHFEGVHDQESRIFDSIKNTKH